MAVGNEEGEFAGDNFSLVLTAVKVDARLIWVLDTSQNSSEYVGRFQSVVKVQIGGVKVGE